MRKLFRTMAITILGTVFLCAADQSQAGMIEYTTHFTASGTLGGHTFTDASVTVVETADLANVNTGGTHSGAILTSSSFTIGNLGTATLVSLYHLQLDNTVGIGGQLNHYMFIDYNIAFQNASYDLKTSFGPITNSSSGGLFDLKNFVEATNLGDLQFVQSSATGDVTFEATVQPVPEPSSFALLGLGGLGAAIAAYRRRRIAAV